MNNNLKVCNWFNAVCAEFLATRFCWSGKWGRHTPDEIFQKEHQKLEDESKQWLNSTSNSCSFIAALITTVAFASSASVPGGLQWQNSTSNASSFFAALIATVAFASSAGVKQDTGESVFEHHLAFSIASLGAPFCWVISLLIFLVIFVSKGEDRFYYKLADEIFIWFNICLYIHGSHVDLFLLGKLLDA